MIDYFIFIYIYIFEINKIDCPKGLLNKSKFKKAYNTFYPDGNTSKFSSFLFEAFDRDKSGYIDFVEYLTALFFLSQNGNLRDQLTFIFKIYDIGK